MCMTSGTEGNENIQRIDNNSTENALRQEENSEKTYNEQTTQSNYNSERNSSSESSQERTTQNSDTLLKIASTVGNIISNIGNILVEGAMKVVDVLLPPRPEVVEQQKVSAEIMAAFKEAISGFFDNINAKYEIINKDIAEKAGVDPEQRYVPDIKEIRYKFDCQQMSPNEFIQALKEEARFYRIFEISEIQSNTANSYEQALNAAIDKGYIEKNDDGNYVVTKDFESSSGTLVQSGTEFPSPAEFKETITRETVQLYSDYSNRTISDSDFDSKMQEIRCSDHGFNIDNVQVGPLTSEDMTQTFASDDFIVGFGSAMVFEEIYNDPNHPYHNQHSDE